MKLFAMNMKRKLWLLAVSAVLFASVLNVISFSDFAEYVNFIELYTGVLWAFTAAFVLSNETENEFAKCYGMSLGRLCAAQYLPCIVFPVLSAELMTHFYQIYYRGSIFGVPEWKTSLSLVVTYMLVSSAAVLIKVIARNSYAALFGIAVVIAPFLTVHTGLLDHSVSGEKAKYDIWITATLADPKIKTPAADWTVNRIVCFALAVVFIALALLLAGRKNYKNV